MRVPYAQHSLAQLCYSKICLIHRLQVHTDTSISEVSECSLTTRAKNSGNRFIASCSTFLGK